MKGEEQPKLFPIFISHPFAFCLLPFIMLKLFLVELKRTWILLQRYAVETISGVAGIAIAFCGLFLSARYVAGPGAQWGDRLDTVVVGYVLWSLMLFIFSDIAGGLQNEAQTGTLEQLFLSPFAAPQIFITRALANLTVQLVLNLSILGIILLLTGSRLSFPPELLLPLVTVLLGAYGLAFAMGSVALLLKQVQRLLGIVQFILFFLLLVPIESWAGSARFLGWLLPMTPGASLLRGLMAQGKPMDWAFLAIALANGVAYFVLGLYLFHLAEREAKRRGKLAGY